MLTFIEGLTLRNSPLKVLASSKSLSRQRKYKTLIKTTTNPSIMKLIVVNSLKLEEHDFQNGVCVQEIPEEVAFYSIVLCYLYV